VIEYVIDSLAEMRLDVFKAHRAVARLPKPMTDTEEWKYAFVNEFADHGFQGYVWPTYVDLEILYAVRFLRDGHGEEARFIDEIGKQMDRMPEAEYGLLTRLNSLNPMWPSELPESWRTRLLRTILLKVIDSPRRIGKLPRIVYSGPDVRLFWEEAFSKAQESAVLKSSQFELHYYEALRALEDASSRAPGARDEIEK
jgi:hypothetical protein